MSKVGRTSLGVTVLCVGVSVASIASGAPSPEGTAQASAIAGAKKQTQQQFTSVSDLATQHKAAITTAAQKAGFDQAGFTTDVKALGKALTSELGDKDAAFKKKWDSPLANVLTVSAIDVKDASKTLAQRLGIPLPEGSLSLSINGKSAQPLSVPLDSTKVTLPNLVPMSVSGATVANASGTFHTEAISNDATTGLALGSATYSTTAKAPAGSHRFAVQYNVKVTAALGFAAAFGGGGVSQSRFELRVMDGADEICVEVRPVSQALASIAAIGLSATLNSTFTISCKAERTLTKDTNYTVVVTAVSSAAVSGVGAAHTSLSATIGQSVAYSN